MDDCDWLLSVEKVCDWLRIEPGGTGNFLLGHPVFGHNPMTRSWNQTHSYSENDLIDVS